MTACVSDSHRGLGSRPAVIEVVVVTAEKYVRVATFSPPVIVECVQTNLEFRSLTSGRRKTETNLTPAVKARFGHETKPSSKCLS